MANHTEGISPSIDRINAALRLQAPPNSTAATADDINAMYIDESSGSIIHLKACTAPCECGDCSNSWYTIKEQAANQNFCYLSHLSDEAVTERISYLVGEIGDSLSDLLNYLSYHSDHFMRLWKKRSRDKRREVIKMLAPDMAEGIDFFFKFAAVPRKFRPFNRDPADNSIDHPIRWKLLLPWLNLDDLSANPSALFALIHYRSTISPSEWATWDSAQLDYSWAQALFDNEFSAKCVSMCISNYGKVTSWSAAAAHRADVLGYPRAVLVLEAQANLFNFLCRLVGKVLQEGNTFSFGDKTPMRSRWDEAASAGFRRDGRPKAWSPFVNQTFSERYTFANQAYSPAPTLHFSQLIALVKAQKALTADDLLDMQYDIHYMRRYIKELRTGTVMRFLSDDVVGPVLARHVKQTFSTWQYWHFLEEELQHTASVARKHRIDIRRGQSLPQEMNRAMGALELIAVNTVNQHTLFFTELVTLLKGTDDLPRFRAQIRSLFPARAPFRRIKPNETVKIEFRRDTLQWIQEDALGWCLANMTMMHDDWKGFSHPMLFSFLEHILASENSFQRSRLDTIMMKQLSNLAAAEEVLLAIRMHRPLHSNHALRDFVGIEGRACWMHQAVKDKENVRATDSRADRLGIAGQRFYDDFYRSYAAPHGNKELEAQQSRNLRKTLEAFWDSVRSFVKGDYAESLLSEQQQATLLEPISAVYTRPYADLMKAEETALQNAKRADDNAADALARLHIRETASPTVENTPKVKTKTRPVISSQTAPDGDNTAVEELPAAREDCIEVNARAHAVFMQMYPYHAEEMSKMVPWEDFVNAMYSAGCVAQNGAGSAVSFEDTLKAKGKVVFHKPHPTPKIDPIMLRSIGRRLAKWFGWHRESFVLEAS